MTVGPKRTGNCTLSTCMKWGKDGSLSPKDQDGLMRHLCSTDPALAGSDACKLCKDDNEGETGTIR